MKLEDLDQLAGELNELRVDAWDIVYGAPTSESHRDARLQLCMARTLVNIGLHLNAIARGASSVIGDVFVGYASAWPESAERPTSDT